MAVRDGIDRTWPASRQPTCRDESPASVGVVKRATPAALVITVSYLAGSVPFSNLVAHRRAGVDLRDIGTGTVSGTSLHRVAGFGALATAGVAEVCKGAVGPLMAGPDRPVLAALAGGAAVCGHNWSILLGGAGGRGLSPALGALAVHDWPGSVTLLAGLAGGRLARQTSLGCFVAIVALVPVLAGTRGRRGALRGAAVAVPILAKRVMGNRPPGSWNGSTILARLVLDRDTWEAPRDVPGVGEGDTRQRAPR